MSVKNIIYIRMKKKITSKFNTMLRLKDVAFITTSYKEKKNVEQTPIYHIKQAHEEYVVIDSFKIIDQLNKVFPEAEFQLLGLTETIVQIKETKKEVASIFLFCFVWIVLFIGTAMTIINFHYDVSMQEVQQKIHYILTGEQEEFPLWIQVPYSVGLGVGMMLFLNRWFKKRLNEEPSPLDVEIFNYQKDLDNYIAYHENELNKEDQN